MANIYHTVNSGLYFHLQNTRIFIDAIHTGKDDGFSLMPPKLLKQLHDNTGLFRHIDAFLFTHLHRDHFDQKFLETALDCSVSQPDVYGPELFLSTISPHPVQEDIECFRIKDVTGYTMKTKHIGKQYLDVPHRSILLATPKESYFIAGDGELVPDKAFSLIKLINSNVKAVFVNVYQLASKDGQEFIRRLSPSRIFLYHFPFPEDDTHKYYQIKKRVLEKIPNDLPTPIIPEPMRWVKN